MVRTSPKIAVMAAAIALASAALAAMPGSGRAQSNWSAIRAADQLVQERSRVQAGEEAAELAAQAARAAQDAAREATAAAAAAKRASARADEAAALASRARAAALQALRAPPSRRTVRAAPTSPAVKPPTRKPQAATPGLAAPIKPVPAEPSPAEPSPAKRAAAVAAAPPDPVPAPAETAPPKDAAAKPASRAAGARILRVGPFQRYRVPSAAAASARNGDIIEIDAANYTGDVAVWRADDLVIKGVNGRPHLRAGGKSAEGKATWVIKGDNTAVENIEFSGSAVSGRNGAGIRLEGTHLTIRNSYFHHNQMGLLTGNDGKSDIVIERSEFALNTVDYGRYRSLGHNIYIGSVNSFTLTGSYVHNATSGHNVKSRARINQIFYNRLMDEAEGASSYVVDLPNGGAAFLVGNIIQQGRSAPNWAVINFNSKHARGKHALHLLNNTIVSDRSNAVFVQNGSDTPAVLVNNLVVGRGEPVQGPARMISNLFAGAGQAGLAERIARTAGRLVGGGPADGNRVVKDAMLVDRAGFDYRLKAGSPAIDAATDPTITWDGATAPNLEYAHPRNLRRRQANGRLDIGAFEFAGPGKADGR